MKILRPLEVAGYRNVAPELAASHEALRSMLEHVVDAVGSDGDVAWDVVHQAEVLLGRCADSGKRPDPHG